MQRLYSALSLFCTWALAAALSTAVVAEEYDLNIQYAGAVGETYDFIASSSGHEYSKSHINGELYEDAQVSSAVALTGGVEFLAVDDQGLVTRLAFRLDSAEAEVDGEPIEVDRSRRLILDLSGDATELAYEGGGAVDGQLHTLLVDALDFSGGLSEEAEGDDAMVRAFGIDVPRAPGARWGIDYEAFFAATDDGGMPFDLVEDQTRSEAHFAELNQTAYGEDVAFVMFEIDSTGFAFVDPNFPDLFETTESQMLVEMDIQLAMDPGSHVGKKSFDFSMGFAAEGDLEEQGQTFHLEIAVEVVMHQSMTLTRPE